MAYIKINPKTFDPSQTNEQKLSKILLKQDEYNTQALQLLYDSQTKMTITFSHKGKYFPDDKQLRHIYNVLLFNDKRKYNFTFGDSIYNTEEFSKAKIKDRRKFVPSFYDVLACLFVDYSENYDDFCDSYGYDKTDEENYPSYRDEQSEKIYHKVKEQSEALKGLFTEQELEKLSEIC